MPLVKRIAYHLMARLAVQRLFDDLVQNGMIGLLDAIGRFEEGFGAQFETYATQRIGVPCSTACGKTIGCPSPAAGIASHRIHDPSA